jgi:hypothetical protein
MNVLVAQQKKLTESLRRRRQKIRFPRNRNTDFTAIPDVDDAPIRPSSPLLNDFPDSPAPFSEDSLQHPPDPMDMSLAYQYNQPRWSMRHTVDHSGNEGSDSTSDSEGDTADSSEECSDDESDNDADLWSDDAEPWLRGMSAISRLEEEFEQEAAARGTTYHINLICL